MLADFFVYNFPHLSYLSNCWLAASIWFYVSSFCLLAAPPLPRLALFFVFFFFVFKLSDSVFLGQSSAEYPARPPASCWTQKKSFLAAVGGIKYSRHTEILKSGQGEVFSNPITSANLICCCTRGKVANTALIAYENCLAAIKLCPLAGFDCEEGRWGEV